MAPRAFHRDASRAATLRSDEHAHFWRFLITLTVFSAVFGAAYGVAGIWLRSTGLGVAFVLDYTFLVATVWAWRLLRRGNASGAALTVSYAVMLLSVCGVGAVPFLFPTLVIVPIIAMAAALPYVSGRPLRVLGGVGVVSAVAIVSLGVWIDDRQAVPTGLVRGLVIATSTVAVSLIIIQLWHFSVRIRGVLRSAQEGEERFLSLAHATSHMIWSTDAGGLVKDDSPSWRSFTGQSYEQWKGAGWLQAVHPEDRERALKAWLKAVQDKEDYEVEYRLRRRDGGYAHTVARATPVLNEDGSIREFVGSNTDITHRKLVEEQLRQANQRKDEFLAMLGHELRNPLAPILTAVQLLRGPQAEKDRDRKLGMIDRQARHLARLVDDLLDVSRITRGKIHLRKETLEVRRVVEKAVETARGSFESRRHQLTVTLPPSPLRVDGDPVRLEQVWVNLLTNAAKYTPPGGQISISVAEEGSEVVVRVRDNGTGISPDFQKQLFQPFVQAPAAQGLAQGGLGIGLALVRALVELHGGTVAVTSVGLGQGSEFAVRLPRLEMPYEVESSETTPIPSSRRGTGLVVMVVDDNVDAAEMLAELLLHEGHQVKVAHTGRAAVELARGLRPQLVLLDIGLPDIDGYEVARQLRAIPEMAPAYLVALTGFGQPSDRMKALDAGFDQHMVKPVDFNELQAAVASASASPSERSLH